MSERGGAIGSRSREAARRHELSRVVPHPLTGDQTGRYAVRLTASYRFTFGWGEEAAVDVSRIPTVK